MINMLFHERHPNYTLNNVDVFTFLFIRFLNMFSLFLFAFILNFKLEQFNSNDITFMPEPYDFVLIF